MAADPPDYDDPDVEEAWCDERRAEVEAYLEEQAVPHGEVGDWPAWHVAPFVSVWAIESATSPGSIGYWVICGDLPTDHVGRDGNPDPREAVRSIAERWRAAAPALEAGEAAGPIGRGRSAAEQRSLAPLLRSRAELLARWASDDDVWEEDEED